MTKMPFREKLRKVISRRDSTSNNGSTSPKSNSTSSRKNSDFYKPGEYIPYKYRRPVAKEHKAKLEAFSFADAWRRGSHQSQYSPMGSRAVSRKNSVSSVIRRPFAKRAFGSVASVNSGFADSARGADTSKEPAHPTLDPQTVGKDFGGNSSSNQRGMDSPHAESPFSTAELTLAFQRSNLEVPVKG